MEINMHKNDNMTTYVKQVISCYFKRHPHQIELGPRVYFFTAPGFCTAWIEMLAMMVLRQHLFSLFETIRPHL